MDCRVRRRLVTSLLLLMMMALPHIASPILVVSMLTSASEEHLSSAPAKEHSEYVVRVKLVLPEVLLVPLVKSLLRAMLIVDSSFFFVVETGESLAYLFEGVSSIRSPVFVRMEFQGKLFVSFLNLILVSRFLQSEYFIVVLLRNYGLAPLDLSSYNGRVLTSSFE